MAGDAETTPITRREAVAHCRKAQEYLRAAEHSLEVGDHSAAAGTAIDAGINAADAVAGMNPRPAMEGRPRAGRSVHRRSGHRLTATSPRKYAACSR